MTWYYAYIVLIVCHPGKLCDWVSFSGVTNGDISGALITVGIVTAL